MSEFPLIDQLGLDIDFYLERPFIRWNQLEQKLRDLNICYLRFTKHLGLGWGARAPGGGFTLWAKDVEPVLEILLREESERQA